MAALSIPQIGPITKVHCGVFARIVTTLLQRVHLLNYMVFCQFIMMDMELFWPHQRSNYP